ncbi:MAG: MgtC/SapB family protein [Halanaerobiales bacterium]
MIVVTTSCLIMILSIRGAGSDLGITNVADPDRLVAQAINGIGFLDVGTIIKQEDKIEGLTTAANLWGVAGLGLVVGYGLYSISIAVALIIFLGLLGG